MPQAGCPVVAFEGPPASGKTTLIYALAAHYRERGVNVAISGEPARTSPFMETIVLHSRGEFDLSAEVDLFGAQLATQLRAARNHTLLFADKTICNVLAYAGLVLDPDDRDTARVLDAMAGFCRAWAPIAYDVVFYLADRFDERPPGDDFRQKVAGLQDKTADAVLDACAEADIDLIDVPRGLSTADRVAFVADHLTRHGEPFPSLP